MNGARSTLVESTTHTYATHTHLCAVYTHGCTHITHTLHTLQTQVGENGSKLSHGERALLAIARVLLRPSSIVVMDEPTANIDPDTDAKLQRIIRQEFASSTLITIAHRLHTVADFDLILVMDQGRCVEFDHPCTLLKKNSTQRP